MDWLGNNSKYGLTCSKSIKYSLKVRIVAFISITLNVQASFVHLYPLHRLVQVMNFGTDIWLCICGGWCQARRSEYRTCWLTGITTHSQSGNTEYKWNYFSFQWWNSPCGNCSWQKSILEIVQALYHHMDKG